ncbi:hypothetical protein ACIPZF_03775 [Pseudomonas sp. NPDC089752]|uniref:hypothetical protein n=1 Tax=Pseudomonas sp. NPDC089752 TaxID=3364472 RepID=UPI0038111CFC
MSSIPPQLISTGNFQLPQSQGEAKVIVATSAVKALHPSLSEAERHQVLDTMYRNVTYLDAFGTGNLIVHPVTGILMFRTKRSEQAWKGFVFEAALARWCREQPEKIGKQAFGWCTGRNPNQISDAFYQKFTVFVRGDKSLLDKRETAILYNTGCPFDVQFYSINPQHELPEIATVKDTKIEAGIQVKAITCNEMAQIIQPILNGEYTHVLTLLNHPSGQHSYSVCQTILSNLLGSGKITLEEYAYVSQRITYPGRLGIDQQMIEEYSAYLSGCYHAGAAWTADVYDALSMEVVKDVYMSQGGVLIPKALPIQIPGQGV